MKVSDQTIQTRAFDDIFSYTLIAIYKISLSNKQCQKWLRSEYIRMEEVLAIMSKCVI